MSKSMEQIIELWLDKGSNTIHTDELAKAIEQFIKENYEPKDTNKKPLEK